MPIATPPSGTASVTCEIAEGPRASVERIAIHGNTRTRDYVICREFDLAERRLKRLGFFNEVREAQTGYLGWGIGHTPK